MPTTLDYLENRIVSPVSGEQSPQGVLLPCCECNHRARGCPDSRSTMTIASLLPEAADSPSWGSKPRKSMSASAFGTPKTRSCGSTLQRNGIRLWSTTAAHHLILSAHLISCTHRQFLSFTYPKTKDCKWFELIIGSILQTLIGFLSSSDYCQTPT